MNYIKNGLMTLALLFLASFLGAGCATVNRLNSEHEENSQPFAVDRVEDVNRNSEAEDTIEKAGVVVGVTAGNLLFLPLKVISVTMGAISGALSYVVAGGNADLTKQIWQDTSQGAYVITPDLARTSIGQRPELHEK